MVHQESPGWRKPGDARHRLGHQTGMHGADLQLPTLPAYSLSIQFSGGTNGMQENDRFGNDGNFIG